MASVASSAAETRSVCFQGNEMSLEAAMDSLIREIQLKLNCLQQKLRDLATAEEQQVDSEEDFRLAVELDDDVNDVVDGMVEILRELPPISADIRGKPPPEMKVWYAKHKADRKDAVKLAKEQARLAAAAEAAKSKTL